SHRADMSYVDLTNPELYEGDHTGVPQQTLNIRRVRAINGRVFERVRVKNYNRYAVEVTIAFSMAADFADIFEVRGLKRHRRGHHAPTSAPDQEVRFGYLGEDSVLREKHMQLFPKTDPLAVGWDRVAADYTLYRAAH